MAITPRGRWRVFALALLAGAPPATAQSAATVERDALEVIQRRCLGCHGPKAKMSGLDLSSRPTAQRGGTKGPALAAGNSLLLERVRKGEMPPGAKLPDAEVQTLSRWIAAGAPWTEPIREKRADPDWWSLQPLKVRPASVQPGIAPEWNRSEIDRWVLAKLRHSGLRPSPPADRRTLVRRVTYDLLGLPPSPAEVEAFINDPASDAYEKLVDRLLASPHYGERWARHWLDVVRFTESEGFERDVLRDHAWRYRDYVIRSFNSDKPYIDFAREQIAGDVGNPVTHEGIVATGMLVLGPNDAIGLTSSVPAERTRVREDQLEELVGTVGQTFLGLTVNCARCHDHKFDPIPQKDYLRMKAAFDLVWQPTRSLDPGGLDEMFPDGRPLLTPAELNQRNRRVTRVEERIATLEAELGNLYRQARPSGQAPGLPVPFARWTFDTDGRDDFGPLHAALTPNVEIAEGRMRTSGKEPVTVATATLPRDVREKTLEAWIRVRELPRKGVTLVEIRNRTGLRGASVDGIHYAGGPDKRWENFSYGHFRTENVKGPPEDTGANGVVHLAISYAADGTVRMYRNGQAYGRAYKPELDAPPGRLQTFGTGDGAIRFTVSPSFDIEEARLYTSVLTDGQVAASFVAGVRSDTTPALKALMREQARSRAVALEREIADRKRELESIPEPEKAFSVTNLDVETSRILIGEVKSMAAGGLSCIPNHSADFGLDAAAPDGARRRKAAEWIANAGNPLFARVMANRVWHYHFGTGIVENPNDFGYNGGEPSHPELLDWLSTEFIRNGWSLKKLHKTILLSETYRQSSRFSAEAAAIDAGNRLLWRFSPRRLEGEEVRDSMLAVSGELNTIMFGPSFQPFKVVQFGTYRRYDSVESASPEQQRRTVYRMTAAGGGNPMLDALDCPLPSLKTPKRPVTTTALQALSLMNSEFVQQQARALASRLSEKTQDVEQRIRHAFALLFGRAPETEEVSDSRSLIEKEGLVAFSWALFNASEFIYVD